MQEEELLRSPTPCRHKPFKQQPQDKAQQQWINHAAWHKHRPPCARAGHEEAWVWHMRIASRRSPTRHGGICGATATCTSSITSRKRPAWGT